MATPAKERDVDHEQFSDDNDTRTHTTTLRGSNRDEYQIYKACAQDLGWVVKSYEEWLRS